MTPFSTFLACLVLLLALVAHFQLGWFGIIAGLLKSRESSGGALLLALAGSILCLLWVRDGFTLYLVLELALLAAAGFLMTMDREGWLDGFYLLLGGSAGASLLLGGVFFLYSVTGTLHLDDMLAQLFIAKNFSAGLLGGMFLTAAWAFLFLFPVPVLFSRLLDRTPPFALGFFSAVLVRAGVYVLFSLLFFTLNVPGLIQPGWFSVLEAILVLLFLSGFVLAAWQKDFLHSVAYLSVAQLGFLFIGLVLGNKSALTGTLMELVSQMLVVEGLFSAVGVLSLKPTGAHPFSKLAGVGRHDFGAALALVILAFSIVGVPPTGGFFGKFFLIQASLEKKDWVFLAALLATMAFNLYTAGRFTWLLFEHRKSTSFHAPVSLSAKAPLLLAALGVLLLGIFHQEIIHNLIEPALPKAFLNLPVPNVPFLGKQVE